MQEFMLRSNSFQKLSLLLIQLHVFHIIIKDNICISLPSVSVCDCQSSVSVLLYFLAEVIYISLYNRD